MGSPAGDAEIVTKGKNNPMPKETSEGAVNPLDEFIDYARNELDQVSVGLREIGLLIEQSQGEVEKLVQRNSSITSRLHQIQAQFETVPRDDIRSAYEAAQDTQQRLFTMRGQSEKLQSDQTNLLRYEDFLTRTISLLESGVTPTIIRPKENVSSAIIEKIISAQEEERRRISRQIHDGPAQALANFILLTEIALRLFDIDPEKARIELNNLKESATTTFAQVRDFIFDLRPMMLDDLGLVPTLRRYTEAFKEKTGLDISLVFTGSERRLEPHREVISFRAIQDVLSNIRDYAQATQVKLSVSIDEDEVRAIIEDNGRMLEHETGSEEETDRVLRVVEDRVHQVGGEFVLESSADGGSKVTISVPSGD